MKIFSFKKFHSKPSNPMLCKKISFSNLSGVGYISKALDNGSEDSKYQTILEPGIFSPSQNISFKMNLFQV